MKHFLPFGVLMAVVTLTLNACGGGAAGGGEHQQAKGRPLPKYEQASLPEGRYHTTEFEPSLSFRIAGDDWRFEGPSTTLGDPEHPDYLFFQRTPEAEISFFNLRKVNGVNKPRGPAGEIEPMPAPDELVGWFQDHPYLKTSEPEPATVGGVKGVQFDVDTDLPKDYSGISSDECCVDIFPLSTGGSYSAYYAKKAHYIVLEDVKGVPVVIQYGDEDFDEFVPVAKKVLDSVEWTGA